MPWKDRGAMSMKEEFVKKALSQHYASSQFLTIQLYL